MSLLWLLLLLDLLLGNIFAVVPLDLNSFTLLNDVLLNKAEALLKSGVLEVIVLLEGENQIEAIAGIVQGAADILQVHENWTVFLLDETGDTSMVEHSSEPESWHSEWGVLDVLDLNGVDF